jgi:hypothetical protein
MRAQQRGTNGFSKIRRFRSGSAVIPPEYSAISVKRPRALRRIVYETYT